MHEASRLLFNHFLKNSASVNVLKQAYMVRFGVLWIFAAVTMANYGHNMQINLKTINF